MALPDRGSVAYSTGTGVDALAGDATRLFTLEGKTLRAYDLDLAVFE